MIVISIILILYSTFLLLCCIGGLFTSYYKGKISNIKSTIVISFRDEEHNLPILWKSILNLKGLSKDIEILFINDNSIDNSLMVLEKLIKSNPIDCRIQVINNPNKGKKSSIQHGVEIAQNQMILITDSDVELDCNWLISMSSALSNAELVLGSVINKKEVNSFLNILQEIESLMLEGIKSGSANICIPLLASGANLGFKKDLFMAVNPYFNNLEILSGDDMFLLQAAKNNKWRILNVSNSPAMTIGAKDWKTSIKQHQRWAAKTPALKNNLLIILGSITILAHFGFLIGVMWIFFESHFVLMLSLILKFFVEFLLLFSRAIIFNRLKLLFFTPIMTVCYPFYLMAVMIGVNKNKKDW